MGGISFAPVPGTDGRYVASSDGRVFGPRRELKPQFRAGRRIRHLPGKGHLKVSLFRDGRQFDRSVHRTIYEAFVGEVTEGLVLRHMDGDPSNNDVSNLAVGTPADNIRDRDRHGRTVSGSAHGCARLTDADVHSIRDRYIFRKVTYRQLADEYGVAEMTIGRIIRGESWRR
ncbi:HNH endonuclease signature motif containing protein [Streptomyces uncialis]|uniref:HNH endonuclease signature motif containing protein n=1 Tax=Streptomyces uncialis TaxID=1048205 RepID=UPI00382CB135